MNGRTDEQMNGQTDGWMDKWMNGMLDEFIQFSLRGLSVSFPAPCLGKKDQVEE